MNDAELHKKIRKRDPSTYEELIGTYSKLLWTVASGILKNVGTIEDIEDCIADCFAYLWEYPEKYDNSRGEIKTYLCLITRSKAIDRLRKINKLTNISYEDDLISESDDIESMIINRKLVKEVYSYAQKLKTIDREIFILRYFYDLKPIEIADKLNLSVKEVSNRLYLSKKIIVSNIDVT